MRRKKRKKLGNTYQGPRRPGSKRPPADNRHLVRATDPPSSEEALRRAEIEFHRQVAYDIIFKHHVPWPFTAREVRYVAAVKMGYGIDVAESIRRRVHEMYEKRDRPDSGRLITVGRDWSRGGMLFMPMGEVLDGSITSNGDEQKQSDPPRPTDQADSKARGRVRRRVRVEEAPLPPQ